MNSDEDKDFTWFWILLIFLFSIAMSGCATTELVECPELDLPEVVETTVTKAVELPLPPEPKYKNPADLGVAWYNFLEADKAQSACREIIKENNEVARQP